MSPSITSDAFVGRRHGVERALVVAMAGQFPVLARGPADELAIVFRTGAAHYGLSGTLATATSTDGGRTWSDPIEVAPRGDDVRNPAFGIAPDGTWRLAYWVAGRRCYPSAADGERSWRLPAATDADPPEPELVITTSADRGRTWTARLGYRSTRLAWASPYGRIVTAADGSLLIAGYGLPRDATTRTTFESIVIRSRDHGATWGDEALVLADASELALCVVSPTLLLGAIRRASGDTAIVRSTDHGATWSAPVAATRAGEHPADLCVLAGRRHLLLTFGRRRRPLGCGALVSDDDGVTWQADREVLLAGDGVGNDVGYPSTVQLADGTLVTALYFARGSSGAEERSWGDTSCQVLRYPATLVDGGRDRPSRP